MERCCKRINDISIVGILPKEELSGLRCVLRQGHAGPHLTKGLWGDVTWQYHPETENIHRENHSQEEMDAIRKKWEHKLPLAAE